LVRIHTALLHGKPSEITETDNIICSFYASSKNNITQSEVRHFPKATQEQIDFYQFPFGAGGSGILEEKKIIQSDSTSVKREQNGNSYPGECHRIRVQGRHKLDSRTRNDPVAIVILVRFSKDWRSLHDGVIWQFFHAFLEVKYSVLD
jgi:hypothetical protein